MVSVPNKVPARNLRILPPNNFVHFVHTWSSLIHSDTEIWKVCIIVFALFTKMMDVKTKLVEPITLVPECFDFGVNELFEIFKKGNFGKCKRSSIFSWTTSNLCHLNNRSILTAHVLWYTMPCEIKFSYVMWKLNFGLHPAEAKLLTEFLSCYCFYTLTSCIPMKLTRESTLIWSHLGFEHEIFNVYEYIIIRPQGRAQAFSMTFFCRS